MTAWDEAATEAAREALYDYTGGRFSWSDTQIATSVLAALAPHLAARDAAVRREALEDAAKRVENYLGSEDDNVILNIAEAIRVMGVMPRALATEATP